MKKLILICAASVLLFSCRKEPSGSNNIPSDITFQLNRVDNIFFTGDNGLLISGVNNLKYTLIKTNSNFGILWTKNNYEWGDIVQGSGWGSSFYSIQMVKAFQRSDGMYVCIGTIMQGGDVVYYTTLVIILNQDGNQIRKYQFDDLAASNALQTVDGGYILFGNKLIKLDGNFNQQWEKNLLDNNYFQYQIVSASEGEFATTGSYNGEQVLLKKYDQDWNELLSSVYKHNNSPFEEAGFNLIQLTDKGFLIIGRSGKSFVPNIIECQIIRTDAEGDTIWTKRFGYPTNSWLENIVTYDNDELVLQGSIGFPDENQKSVLVKINTDGQILDSISSEKFQMMVYSPLMFYIKVQNNDAGDINFSLIEPNKLFTKNN